MRRAVSDLETCDSYSFANSPRRMMKMNHHSVYPHICKIAKAFEARLVTPVPQINRQMIDGSNKPFTSEH
jgi:hypothetical protein